jgi:predicted phage replisome organizer
MHTNKTFYWLRLHDNFFSDIRIKKLRKIAGGDTYTIIYQKMLLLSLKEEGNLFFEGVEENFAEEIALSIDEETDNVLFTIMYLLKCNLLQKNDEFSYLLPEVKFLTGSETQGALRVRRHRETKKALQCNKSVTPEIEIEIEIEKEKKKEINTGGVGGKKIIPIFDMSEINIAVHETLQDFIQMRKEIKAPLTNKAFSLLVKNLNVLASSPVEQVKILEQSILNNWKGIFAVSDKNKFVGSTAKSTARNYQDAEQAFYKNKPALKELQEVNGDDF